MTVVRFLYTIVIALSYAVIIYPIRAVVMDWLRVKHDTRGYKISFYIIPLVLTLLSLLLSALVPSIV